MLAGASSGPAARFTRRNDHRYNLAMASAGVRSSARGPRASPAHRDEAAHSPEPERLKPWERPDALHCRSLRVFWRRASGFARAVPSQGSTNVRQSCRLPVSDTESRHCDIVGMASAGGPPGGDDAADKKPIESTHYAWAEEMKRRGEELKRLGVDSTPQALDDPSVAATAGSDSDLSRAQSKGSAWNTGGTW